MHVTNLGQTAASTGTAAHYVANTFTTGGSTTDRFSLTSVIIDFRPTNAGDAPTVGIYTVSSSNPGTRVGANLVRQCTGTPTGQTTYNAPSAGITLNGGTTYFVRSQISGGTVPWLKRTASNNEDSSTTTDWSIGDVYKYSTTGTSWTDDGSGRSLLFRVNARKRAPLSADMVTLTGARLTIANHSTAWHYKADKAPHNTCSAQVPAGTSRVTLTGLTQNTAYVYKAYSNSTCATANELTTNATDADFTTLADTTPPSVVTGGYSPADNATGVGTNANLVLTFNEAVQKGTGNIVIRTGTNTDITIDVTSNQVSVGGSGNTVVTINPTNDLSASTAYRVRIAGGVIKDTANNNWAGINDDTTWNFETAAAPDTTPPQLASNPFSPADGATGVPLNATFTATFNESVQRDTSKYIRLWAAGADNPTPITVSISGATVTIDPDGNLGPNLDHSIWFENGAIEDLAGNNYAGFENATTWNVTTGSTTVTPVTPVTPGGGGGSVSPPRPNLEPAFGDMTPISLTLVQHETLAPLILPAADSGDGTLTYTLTPAPPPGLVFDAATRTISGTPTAAQAETRYTLTAEDEDYDMAELSFTLAVRADETPGFGDRTVADRTFQLQARRQGQPPGQPGPRRGRARPRAITPLVLPAATGGDAPLTYALTPAPPPGLIFDETSRTIRGAPTAVQAATPYRYTVTDNDGDTATLAFTLAVTAPGPSQTEQRVVGAAMAELGRATLAGAADVIRARINTPSGDRGLVLAGRRLPLSAFPGTEEPDTVRLAGATDPWHEAVTTGAGVEGALHAGTTPDLDEVLRDSAFSVPLNGDNAETAHTAPALTLWGRSFARRHVAGQSGSGGWDGATRAAWLGLDARLPGSGLLAGLAVARSEGDADYRYADTESHRGGEGNGELDTSMTTLWPYLSKPLSGGGSVQLMLGAGWGELTRRAGAPDTDVEQDAAQDGDADRLKTKADLGLLAGVLGGSRPFAWTGGLTFSALGEASAVRLTTGDSPDVTLADQAIWAWRVRGGIEARHAGIILPVRDWLLSPRGTVSVRHDGGDGVTGAGLELAGGFNLAGPGSRWAMNLTGHWLALHAAEGRREWGVSLNMQLNPRPGGLGWLFSLSPRWGSERDSTALAGENVFATGRPGTGDIHSTHSAPSLAARLGYGLHALGGRFTLTPALEVDVSGAGREVGVGWQLTPRSGADGHARPLALSFEAVRREHRHTRVTHPSDPSHPSAPTEHEVWLRLEAGY